MTIKKDDLALTHYEWGGHELTSRVDLSPSRNFFDRTNGIHILWLLNWYLQHYASLGKKRISDIEMLIAEQLPKDLRSEISVCRWMLNAAT